ncbi:MAG: twin-arginine translocase TatA/TatE family subunit [Euryarchaeota archaeon]|nr:twin-arginine translocase TatA/TatE family subunit [Euryarchaeota archaeon]MDE1835806.1 twin-arginine translocase TatA/TatE family subunit [Euryarchaeota archaeon]MDE1880720.1 twin-arginine translocase TatA/TatE family subunit [Euryarchaeota archaeon]MDE2043997.1 twin-arginine translocase TatA/TatE family subunit [Thermoplasmata archaeon]
MFDSIDDWLIIGVIFAILFWGSTKIPQLAHSLGRAVGEFKKGKLESERELAQSQAAPASTAAPRVVRDNPSGR